jgi:hypothetical protein
MIRKFAYANFVSYFGDEINQKDAWMMTPKEKEYSLRAGRLSQTCPNADFFRVGNVIAN